MQLGYSDRKNKPREFGLNFAIDGGLPTTLFADYITSFSQMIDGVKFGWGSGVVTPQIDQKTKILQDAGIPYWFGGTAFEIAYKSDKLDEFLAWAKDKGARRFEVSDGVIELPSDTRRELIQNIAKDFEVYTEVGSKDASVILSPSVWVDMIKADFEAGAAKVIMEGRESGAAGMYRKDGEVRTGLIDDIALSGIDIDKLIFEAPVKAQQVWFVKRFGRHCNMANLPFDAILNVETLRRGLRTDTFGGGV